MAVVALAGFTLVFGVWPDPLAQAARNAAPVPIAARADTRECGSVGARSGSDGLAWPVAPAPGPTDRSSRITVPVRISHPTGKNSHRYLTFPSSHPARV